MRIEELDINLCMDGLKIFDDINLHSRKSLEAKLNFQFRRSSSTNRSTSKHHDTDSGKEDMRGGRRSRDMSVVKLKRTANVSRPTRAMQAVVQGLLLLLLPVPSQLLCFACSVVSWSSEK